MTSKRQRSRGAVAHDDGEFLWLVSLSDLMILLFVFMLVLFSFSFKNMSASELIEAVAVFNGDPDTAIDEIEEKLRESISAKGLGNMVDIEQDKGTLVMNIKDAVLFESGRYTLKDESLQLLNSMSKVFVDLPHEYHLAVEGHTDDAPFNVPGGGAGIKDNFQLSVMRAYEVFQHLSLPYSLLKKTSIVGYGPMKPLVANRDSAGVPILENRAKNRRVTVKIY